MIGSDPLRVVLRFAHAVVAIAALCFLAGCGGGDGVPPGAPTRLGAPEGALRLLALPGYVENGSVNPRLDWVTPFENATGCQVSSTTASSPARVTRLLGTGDYDGVSARGDVSGSLVAEGLVKPINTRLIPNYDKIFPALKGLPDNRVDGDTYGIPVGRFANFLLWRTDVVAMPHTDLVQSTSSVLFDPGIASRHRGRVTEYDDPMTIADAALFLRKHDHDLGIDDVYELDREQLDAVTRLLIQQRANIGHYWRDSSQNVEAFVSGASVVGPAWQVSINGILRGRVKVKAAVPDEHSTGISDSWMIASGARHPNCMYLWMNYTSGAQANAAIAQHTGQAPASEHACDETRSPGFCDTYRASDEELFDKVDFWTTPLRDCGDGRGDVCTDYADWARAWRQVTRG